MKVLYFHQHYTNPKGSVGVRSYAMANALAARGHEVCIVCGSYDGGDTGLYGPYENGMRRGFVNDKIEVIEFELPYSNKSSFMTRINVFLIYAWRSIGLAMGEKYDVIFASSTPLTVAIPGIVARILRRKIFILEIRDLWPELPVAMGVIKNPVFILLLALLERCAYMAATHVVALSPGIKEGVVKKGVSEEQVSLLSNGCDIDIFSVQAGNGWRPSGVEKSEFLALYAGTHGLANGLENLSEVAEELQRRGRRDIKIVLIGDGEQKQLLQRRAVSSGCSNIIFHDAVSKIRLAGIMAEADIGLQVLANIREFYYGTSPNKFFDYISSGLPVLTNYPGWVADLIRENDCGVVVPPDDPLAFADALEAAAKDRSQLRKQARNSKILAIEKFEREKISAQFVDKFECIFKEKIGS